MLNCGKPAVWQQTIFDKNKVGTDVVKQYIKCIEAEMSALSNNIALGIITPETQLVLVSDTPRAKTIKSDDVIIWNGRKYSVQTTKAIPNTYGINSYDVYIFVK